MRLKIFGDIQPTSSISTTGNILICVVTLTAALWTLKELAEDEETASFILDSLSEQMDSNDDPNYKWDFGGTGIGLF